MRAVTAESIVVKPSQILSSTHGRTKSTYMSRIFVFYFVGIKRKKAPFPLSPLHLLTSLHYVVPNHAHKRLFSEVI